MSFRPNSNSRLPRFRQSPAFAVAMLTAVAVIMVFASLLGDREHGAGPPTSLLPARQGKVVNPIEEALKPPASSAVGEGVAAAVLIDTSGSMAGTVRDDRGQSRPKLDIARRCLAELVLQAEEFCRSHPDRQVLLGLYEFSDRGRGDPCRQLLALARPDASAARAAVARMTPDGATPIGDAMIRAKRDLDAAGLSRTHILVITDGENNRGYALPDVVEAISRLPEAGRPSVYLIAFDVAAEKFSAVRAAGGLVLSATNAQELKQSLDYVLTGKILAEQPEPPAKPGG